MAMLLFSGSAAAQPVVLTDAELAGVSAGFYELTSVAQPDTGVVGDSADMQVDRESAVRLDGGAQSRARAAALVNATQSAVANGTNLRDGLDTVESFQSNQILQQSAAQAFVGDWRPQDVHQVTRETEAYESSFQGGIEPAVFRFPFHETERVDGGSAQPTDNDRGDEVLRIGKGVAAAGEVDLEVDGSSFGFSETNSTTATIKTIVTAETKIKIWKFTITLKASSEVVTTTRELESGVSGTVVMPALSLHEKGVICSVVVGNCLPYVGEYRSSSQSHEITLYPAQVQDASAERVVLSEGELHEARDSSVSLEGGSQARLSALHAVNAAGGRIGNGLNVARASAAGAVRGVAPLRQLNEITQSR